MSEKTLVKMTGNFAANVKGDVCGFNDAIAQQLIKRGLAKPLPKPKQEAQSEDKMPDDVESPKRVDKKRKRWL